MGKLNIRIYQGLGASEENLNTLYKKLQKLLCQKKYYISTISPEDTIKGEWKGDTHTYVVGGGYDLGFIQAFGSKGMAQIRDFVNKGGKYLGICAGAYFACDAIEFDKDGPQEVCGERQLNFFPGVCVGPVYGPYDYHSKISAEATGLAYVPGNHSNSSSAQNIKIYYNGGGMFVPHSKFDKNTVRKQHICLNVLHKENHGQHSEVKTNPKHFLYLNTEGSKDPLHFSNNRKKEEQIICDQNLFNEENIYDINSISNSKSLNLDHKILGCYSDIPGEPVAAVRCQVGLGTAVLTGLHPEYNSTDLNPDDPLLTPIIGTLHNQDNEIDQHFQYLLDNLDTIS